ncbi:hypothetical protein [Undibacterium luofuense]|uniref:Uncharacterized protein n=1 Tax=Undibacterium luofuense TaxID=2828733 RepID=A0A941DQL8_9BURK|nr:hypothetical protein [Undibacterium luofuense]MBR7784145.1 hypothetical protein [Undibacterium luofuense]
MLLLLPELEKSPVFLRGAFCFLAEIGDEPLCWDVKIRFAFYDYDAIVDAVLSFLIQVIKQRDTRWAVTTSQKSGRIDKVYIASEAGEPLF